jgi:hypothetical protein
VRVRGGDESPPRGAWHKPDRVLMIEITRAVGPGSAQPHIRSQSPSMRPRGSGRSGMSPSMSGRNPASSSAEQPAIVEDDVRKSNPMRSRDVTSQPTVTHWSSSAGLTRLSFTASRALAGPPPSPCVRRRRTPSWFKSRGRSAPRKRRRHRATPGRRPSVSLPPSSAISRAEATSADKQTNPLQHFIGCRWPSCA